jgi:meso-butanediol dehydrogenase/(S,S)-butanediol dehydrogenase/diacetyl reductase
VDRPAPLEGKVVIVTGAAGAIGRAISAHLAAEGARVVVADLKGEDAAAVADSIRRDGHEAWSTTVDVTHEDGPSDLVTETVRHYGRLDAMIANAGILSVRPILEMSAAEWDRVFAVNTRGVFLCFQAAARQLVAQQTGGRLVATASISAKIGSPFQAHYQSSKSALLGLVRSAAWEFGPHGITVNAFCPGNVDTPMWGIIDRDRGALLGKAPGELFREVAGRSPLGRTQVPSDIPPLVAFLVSDGSAAITGQAINVDNGVVMY